MEPTKKKFLLDDIVNAFETNGKINSMIKSFDLMFRVKFFLKMTTA